MGRAWLLMVCPLALAMAIAVAALGAAPGKSSARPAADLPDPWPVSEYVGLWTAPPPNVVTNQATTGPIIGNGNIGAVLDGGAANLTLWLSSNQFWGLKHYSYPIANEPHWPSPMAMGGVTFFVPALQSDPSADDNGDGDD